MPALSPPAEEADLRPDRHLCRAGITSDPLTHNSLAPTIGDLYETLLHMGGSGPQLAQRLRKYTTGTFAGIFSQQSNIDINNTMVVFNIRDLEDELRPVAMYIVLSPHLEQNSARTKETHTDRRRGLAAHEIR